MTVTIASAQRQVKQLFSGVEHPRLGALLALVEEVGELAKESLELECYGTGDRARFQAELGDVLITLLEVANLYGADLEVAFQSRAAELPARVREWQAMGVEALTRARERMD